MLRNKSEFLKTVNGFCRLEKLPLRAIGLGQWFLSGAILSPREHLTMSGDNFVTTLGQGGECYWNLVVRGGRCCKPSSEPRTGPHI